MKIIHTSDWHIGQNFYSYDRSDEHRHFFSQLADLMRQEQPDALVVSGDIFHTPAPTLGAQQLLVWGVVQLRDACPSTCIIITAGNHDSGSRLEIHSELWRRHNIHVVGGSWRGDDGSFEPDRFIIPVGDCGFVVAAPFYHPSNFPNVGAECEREERRQEFFDFLMGETAKRNDRRLPVVLMAHLAVAGCDVTGHEDLPVGGFDTVPLTKMGEGYDYLALGHIHKSQPVGEKAWYCGTPLPVSFSEGYDHYVNVVAIENHGDEPKVNQCRLSLLRKVKTLPFEPGSLDKALAELANLKDDDTAYLRLIVDQPDILAPDAPERAAKLAENKKCRFCEVRRVRKTQTSECEDTAEEVKELTDIERLDPMNIAKRSYRLKNDAEMNEELEKLLQEAIDSVQTEQTV